MRGSRVTGEMSQSPAIWMRDTMVDQEMRIEKNRGIEVMMAHFLNSVILMIGLVMEVMSESSD